MFCTKHIQKRLIYIKLPLYRKCKTRLTKLNAGNSLTVLHFVSSFIELVLPSWPEPLLLTEKKKLHHTHYIEINITTGVSTIKINNPLDRYVKLSLYP